MKTFIDKFRTYIRLGLLNIIRVAIYRFNTKFKYSNLRRLTNQTPSGIFFTDSHLNSKNKLESSKKWVNEIILFNHLTYPENNIPDWHKNYITNNKSSNSNKNWWEIKDFDTSSGDIKIIWELSRFSWIIPFAQSAIQGDAKSLEKLNNWLNDWCKNNPPYKGSNWKCGQEASFRVINIIIASYILNQYQSPSKILIEFISMHLKRIDKSIQYAVAQDNNHATSEAAALFIGGSFLRINGIKNGIAWEKKGVKWLENRVIRLVSGDGSFSQHSTNYHRLFLDTMSYVEFWRKLNKIQPFSDKFYQKCRLALNWLFSMVSPINGDAPNIGANDGACLLQFSDTDFRDFRPSVQLASALFFNLKAYKEEDNYNLSLRWLDIKVPELSLKIEENIQYLDGGYSIMKRNSTMAVLKFPKYKFRPSQSDGLHLDLWKDGDNLLRDGGSYSYASTNKNLSYFNGSKSHNIIIFDNRDQMPKLSRFLFGSWTKTLFIKKLENFKDSSSFSAGYRDSFGATHIRKVSLNNSSLKVEDDIKGFKKTALLQWRLSPANWQVKGKTITNGNKILLIESTMQIKRFELKKGMESRYYLKKNVLPVLEIEFDSPGKIISHYKW